MSSPQAEMTTSKIIRSFAHQVKGEIKYKIKMHRLKRSQRLSPDWQSGPSLQKLAPELIDMICAYLKPIDIANLRWLCRNIAKIGLEHLVPEINLFLDAKSFSQLQDIAQHPVISQYVKELHYNTDFLPALARRKPWVGMIHANSRYILPMPLTWPQISRLALLGVNERTERIKSDMCSIYPAAHAKRMCTEYKKLAFEQAAMSDSEFHRKILLTSLNAFPALRVIKIVTDQAQKPGLEYCLDQALTEAKEKPVNHSSSWASHHAQVILRGTSRSAANIGIRTLSLITVSWQFLLQDQLQFPIMKEAICDLEKLQIALITRHSDPEESSLNDLFETVHCFQLLDQGVLSDFTSTARRLVTLNFATGTKLGLPLAIADQVKLRYVVGDSQWLHLKNVYFGRIRATEEDLIDFCRRHSPTLENLRLHDITLSEGFWHTTVQQMRNTLSLKKCTFKGLLLDEGPQAWDTDYPLDNRWPALGTLMAAYILDNTGPDIAFCSFVIGDLQIHRTPSGSFFIPES